MKTMRAAVFKDPRTVVLEERFLPDVEANSVRVRMEGCGVCGSNLPVWQGRPWFKYPFPAGAPGHEGWGTIDAVGDGVTKVSVGQRVAILSHHAFAEYDVAPSQHVVPLPPALDGQPVPGEALGCAMNVFCRSGIRPGQTVAIVGIGFMGALLTNLAASSGARVIAISRRPAALEIAREMGATQVFPIEPAADIPEEIQRILGRDGCECVIEAAGLQSTLDLASSITGERGRLVIAGYHQDRARQIDLQSWNWRGLDVINAHERDPLVYVDGIRAAIGALLDGRLDPTPLYSHQFSLERLPDAFEAMHQRPADFFKALLTYD